ncbi:hypothetical protein sos41_35390 [Alphaproteobacteria bacterium SO-S41]|nr:hypothetical protein sos41_35390 [Alphaproteobacteria bacterium SO-S41]
MRRLFFRNKSLFSFAAAFAALFVFAAPAMAKQCVWNKAGVTLRVDWVKPEALLIEKSTADGFTEYSFTEQPTQTDVFPLASGRCIDRGKTPYIAVLSVCGVVPDQYKSRIMNFPSDWSDDQRPNGCAIFHAETTSTSRWLDVWGTLFDPKTGPGGPI